MVTPAIVPSRIRNEGRSTYHRPIEKFLECDGRSAGKYERRTHVRKPSRSGARVRSDHKCHQEPPISDDATFNDHEHGQLICYHTFGESRTRYGFRGVKVGEASVTPRTRIQKIATRKCQERGPTCGGPSCGCHKRRRRHPIECNDDPSHSTSVIRADVD